VFVDGDEVRAVALFDDDEAEAFLFVVEPAAFDDEKIILRGGAVDDGRVFVDVVLAAFAVRDHSYSVLLLIVFIVGSGIMVGLVFCRDLDSGGEGLTRWSMRNNGLGSPGCPSFSFLVCEDQ
jgi:hypothetical protein